jgi:hypothetical protein
MKKWRASYRKFLCIHFFLCEIVKILTTKNTYKGN